MKKYAQQAIRCVGRINVVNLLVQAAVITR